MLFRDSVAAGSDSHDQSSDDETSGSPKKGTKCKFVLEDVDEHDAAFNEEQAELRRLEAGDPTHSDYALSNNGGSSPLDLSEDSDA